MGALYLSCSNDLKEIIALIYYSIPAIIYVILLQFKSLVICPLSHSHTARADYNQIDYSEFYHCKYITYALPNFFSNMYIDISANLFMNPTTLNHQLAIFKKSNLCS